MTEKENFLKLLHSKEEQDIALALQILEVHPVFEPFLEKYKQLARTLNKTLSSPEAWKVFLTEFNSKTDLDLTNGKEGGVNIDFVLEQLLHFPKIVHLDLSRNYLYWIPSGLCQLTHLQALRLQGNYLESIPDNFGNLTNLKVLNLRGNHGLKTLPSTFEQHQNLTELILIKNDFKTFPLQITALKELKILYLQINDLIKIPSEIKNLNKLETLHLGSNKLKILPPEIGLLENLQYLYLDGNQLTEIPSEVEKLKNLRRLDLRGNHLKSLPIEISKMSSLRELNLQDNFLSIEEEDKIKAWLPHCTISFESDFQEDW